MSRDFSHFFIFLPPGKTLQTAARGGAITRTAIQGLRPPLRDSQEEGALWLCPLCGWEQYRLDRARLWRGRYICARCRARIEEEEDE